MMSMPGGPDALRGDDFRCWVPEAGQRLRRFVTRRCPGTDQLARFVEREPSPPLKA
jgi:hypothetical protein